MTRMKATSDTLSRRLEPARSGRMSSAKTILHPFPCTRYQGSKRKLAAAIVKELSELDFHTVLDAFGGTGAVAHAFKRAGKAVTYNDVLSFNHQIGLALIENDQVRLDPEKAAGLGVPGDGVAYDDFIERTFHGVYFTDDENRWLDRAVVNIGSIHDRYARAMAWFAVFQAAMAKRPYNLFHRRNLYMRTAPVRRGFGNKTTWDRGFEEHVRRYVQEANAAIIDAGGSCRATCNDVMLIDSSFDLVYVDTPYINRRGVGVDYRDFYHFLEGLVRYAEWPANIDEASKHRRLLRIENGWTEATRIHGLFNDLFEKFCDSILAVSYRSDGIPTIDELAAAMKRFKRRVRVVELGSYQYVLSTNRRSREVLIIGA
jgi:adenine-specific DNA-methyltransferase